MNFNLEQRLDTETQKELDELLKRHEKSIHCGFSGSLFDRFASILNWYERNSADATTKNKKMIEDTVTYLLSFKMLCEMVSMGQTHGEKAARLRGMIELLDSSIQKLRNEQTDSIFGSQFGWGSFSDYPYQSILRKYDELKRENDELKIQVSKLPEPPKS
jgi:hypothetical protein